MSRRARVMTAGSAVLGLALPACALAARVAVGETPLASGVVPSASLGDRTLRLVRRSSVARLP